MYYPNAKQIVKEHKTSNFNSKKKFSVQLHILPKYKNKKNFSRILFAFQSVNIYFQIYWLIFIAIKF